MILLDEYLKLKPIMGNFSLLKWMKEDWQKAYQKTELEIQQINFPDSEPAKKFTEEIIKKIPAKFEMPTNQYFAYQNDTSKIMHSIVQSTINLFIMLSKDSKIYILPYITRLTELELKNEKSPILSQSIALSELCEFYSNSLNLSRQFNKKIVTEPTKLWLFNEYFLYIFHPTKSQIIQISNTENSKTEFNLKIRNISLDASFSIKTHNLQIPKINSPQDTLKSLTQLKTNEKLPSLDPKLMEIFPEFIIDLLPANYMRNKVEKIINFTPFIGTVKIHNLLESLDKISPITFHKIGIFCIGPNCDFTEKSIYNNENNATTRFNKCLSNLGNFITRNDCTPEILENIGIEGEFIGIFYNSEIENCFFFVNTLMNLQKYDTECLILWNESGKEIPNDFIEKLICKIIILIKPLKDEYCQINFINVFFLKFI